MFRSRNQFSNPVPRGDVALAVTDWYIDPIRGKDSNPGTGPSLALRTYAEYVIRVGGPSRTVNHPLTFHLLGDLPDSDPVYGSFQCLGGGYVDVLGENLTVLHSGVLQYRSFNAASATPPGISDSEVASWAPYVNKLVQMTSGAHANQNAKFWITKDEGSVGRISFPSYRANLFALLPFSPANGSSYDILEPRKASLTFHVTGDEPTTRFSCNIENLRPQGGPITGQDAIYVVESPLAFHWWCDFPFYVVSCTESTVAGSLFRGVVAGAGTLTMNDCVMKTLDCQIKTLFMGGNMTVQASSPLSFHYPGASGAYFDGPGANLAIFDQGSSWLFGNHGAVLEVRGSLWGSGNTGPAADLPQGRLIQRVETFRYLSSTNGQGAYPGGSYDVRVAGKTALNAFDPAAASYNATPRALTWAKIADTYANGGFGGSAMDPITGFGVQQG